MIHTHVCLHVEHGQVSTTITRHNTKDSTGVQLIALTKILTMSWKCTWLFSSANFLKLFCLYPSQIFTIYYEFSSTLWPHQPAQ